MKHLQHPEHEKIWIIYAHAKETELIFIFQFIIDEHQTIYLFCLCTAFYSTQFSK